MEAINELAKTFAFLDAVAEGEGRGDKFITDNLRKEAGQRAALVVPLIEVAAGYMVGEYLASKMPNVNLDPDDPFSDASLSAALSEVLGVPVSSVRNREALRESFKAAVTLQVSRAMGYQFENVFDKAAVRRDALRWVGQHSGEVVPGLYLGDLSDREQTVSDLWEYGRRMVSSVTGINFQNLRSKQQIKEDVYAYVLPEIEAMVGAEGEREYKQPIKMDLKHIRNREAVRRFRAAHGSRQTYMAVDGG